MSKTGEGMPPVSLPTVQSRNHSLPERQLCSTPCNLTENFSTRLPPYPAITENIKLAFGKEDHLISYALLSIHQESSAPLTWSPYHASSMSFEDLSQQSTLFYLYEKSYHTSHGHTWHDNLTKGHITPRSKSSYFL